LQENNSIEVLARVVCSTISTTRIAETVLLVLSSLEVFFFVRAQTMQHTMTIIGATAMTNDFIKNWPELRKLSGLSVSRRQSNENHDSAELATPSSALKMLCSDSGHLQHSLLVGG
jgi:hypothetical protein